MNGQDWDYDEHYAKHSVRYYGWLPTSANYKSQNGVKAIKYFTLCGVRALDIFTLEKGGVLSRDASNKLRNVIICERDLSLIPDIFKVVCPPVGEAIIAGKIEEIMFYDDSQLENAKNRANRRGRKGITDRNVRRIRDVKRSSEFLRASFPFHIINFDVCGSMINNKKLRDSFFEMVKLQTGHIESFLAFLTTECHSIETPTENQFRQCIERNVSEHPVIREALVSKYETTTYDEIEPEELRLLTGFVKCYVIPALAELGWVIKQQGIYVYENPNYKKMLSLVVELTDENSEVGTENCVNEVIDFIRTDPAFVSFEGAERDRVMVNHLNDVIEYRKNLPREYE